MDTYGPLQGNCFRPHAIKCTCLSRNFSMQYCTTVAQLASAVGKPKSDVMVFGWWGGISTTERQTQEGSGRL